MISRRAVANAVVGIDGVKITSAVVGVTDCVVKLPTLVCVLFWALTPTRVFCKDVYTFYSCINYTCI